VQGFHPARAQAANAWTERGVLRIGVLRDIDSIDPLLSGQERLERHRGARVLLARAFRRSREHDPRRRARAPDPPERRDQRRRPPHGANFTFWADPQVGRWLALAVARYGEAERAPYYRLVPRGGPAAHDPLA
jgi:hypothetical protein